ncbi:hypothetical protein [Methylotenera sp.]|uniref:hypothetical protein n=1 Tax=Methylotenera sp. TaxID=2051956 RepID=UPI00272FA93A|nr:hypothetical protein [Methylotenera sp.]MDP2229582.1 hypothetical protein [Methylotenera sp.]MDP3141506.1 hypothetical protein [Methylotenera sp.]
MVVIAVVIQSHPSTGSGYGWLLCHQNRLQDASHPSTGSGYKSVPMVAIAVVIQSHPSTGSGCGWDDRVQRFL